MRAVEDRDLPIFFAQQLDPEATRMAAFPSRDHDAFMAHWAKILAGAKGNVIRTIVFQGQVAGNVGSWEQAGERNVGYWLGREFWGKGIASAALSLFLGEVRMRPLHAHVVKHNVASIRVLQKCGFVVSGEDKFPDTARSRGRGFILILKGLS
ncbi:MAG: GNAT family N-acetyltransferase [Lacunisphaera sp.]